MTYHTDNKIRRYVKGYGFMSFAKNLGSKYGKTIIDKEFQYLKVIKKSAEATGDLSGSKIADKITSGKKDEEPQ